MIRPRLAIWPWAAMLASGLAAAPADASCKLDYGTKLLRWVERDAGSQSRALARTDFDARSFNALLIGSEDLHRRAAAIAERLDALSTAIDSAERQIDAIAADTGIDRELIRAILRDQSAAQVGSGLDEARRELARLTGLREELFADPTRDGFMRAGLNNVGRAFLIASLQEMGDLTRLDLADRYGFYVGVSIGDNGVVQTDPAMNVGMVDTLVLAGAVYATGPWSPLVMAGYYTARYFWQKEECDRARKTQDKRVAKASKRLGKVLIPLDDQFVLYDGLYRANRAKFEGTLGALKATETKLLDRWKPLAAFNAERSAAARTVLSAAAIAEVRRRLDQDARLQRLFDNLGRARLSADIGEVGRFEAIKQRAGLEACAGVDGLRALERLDDAIGYAGAVYGSFEHQPSMIPLQPLVSARRAASTTARERATRWRAALAGKPCGGSTTAGASIPQSALMIASPPALAPALLVEDRTQLATELQAAATPIIRSGLAGFEPLLMHTAAVSEAVAANDLHFCIMWKWGGAYQCGGGAGGAPYSSQFPGGTNPGGAIMQRANDGGFRADARISAGIDGVRANIEQRIADVTARSAGAMAALPAWSTQNGAALASLETATSARIGGEQRRRQEFVIAQQPLAASARLSIDAFLASPSAAANADQLAQAIGQAQLALPEIVAADVPPDAPTVAGVTAPRRVYGSEISSVRRAIVQERLKVERDLPTGSSARALAKEALDAAEQLAAAGVPPNLVDALLGDAAALRYAERGKLQDHMLSVINIDGQLDRVAVADISKLPVQSLIAQLRAYKAGEQLLEEGIASLESHRSEMSAGSLRVLALAERLRDRARAEFVAGFVTVAHYAQIWAMPLLDLTVSLTPVVGLARDVYEAMSGRDLFSNEPLDTVGLTAAVIGVVTGGFGDDIFDLYKAMGKLHDIGIDPSHAKSFLDKVDDLHVGNISDEGLHILERQTERGLSTDEWNGIIETGRRYFDREGGNLALAMPSRFEVVTDTERYWTNTVVAIIDPKPLSDLPMKAVTVIRYKTDDIGKIPWTVDGTQFRFEPLFRAP